jgi:hypothetical protein
VLFCCSNYSFEFKFNQFKWKLFPQVATQPSSSLTDAIKPFTITLAQ